MSIYLTHNRMRDLYAIHEQERGPRFSKIIGKGKRVLDLGARDGALTKYFMEGNDVTAVDIDHIALDNFFSETICADLNGDWKDIPSGFDVVVMGETLEHLYYPDKILEKVKERLNPNGVFIGSVPNAFHWMTRFYFLMGKKHGALTDPTHINHFSRKELEQLLKRHFETVNLTEILPSVLGANDFMFVCFR